MKVKTKKVRFRWSPPSLCNPAFKYRSSADTDVQQSWKKYGWTPPSEARHG